MMFAVIVASKYEKPIDTAEDLLKSGQPYFCVFCQTGVQSLPSLVTESLREAINQNKTIEDGGITIDFWIIKVHTSN